MDPVTVRWTRIDLPGTDQATLRRDSDCWHVEGQAEFADGPARWRLEYVVACDPDWTTRSAAVTGMHDAAAVSALVTRNPSGRWSLNGEEVPALSGLADVDLAFTPATNLLPIRRLGLAVGEAAEVVSAWLTFPELSLVPLRQHYRRVSPTVYAYRAPDLGFAASLTVNEHGFVVDYPELWAAGPSQ